MCLVSLDCLTQILNVLVDKEVETGACSSEKLIFRLRVLGGAFRRCPFAASNSILFMNTANLLIKEEIMYHDDRSVRKSVSKSKRDIIRGRATIENTPQSLFPSPRYPGAPNDLSKVKLEWTELSPESVSYVVTVMQQSFTSSMRSIESLLSAATADHDNCNGIAEDKKLSPKKIEERIVTHLHTLFKSLRGAAELLSDDLLIDPDPSYLSKVGLLPTGKQALIKCSEEDQLFLKNVRPAALSFLLNFQAQLTSIDNKEGHELLASLTLNQDIQSLWMKIFESLVNVRMALGKDVDKYKTWFTMVLLYLNFLFSHALIV